LLFGEIERGNQSMKALVYDGAKDIEYREETDPQVGASEVLLQVEAAGICGSDLHVYFGHDSRRVPPLVLGHEVVGVIESGKRAGERVLVNPFITCGHCRYCTTGRSNICPNRQLIGLQRLGGFAEHLAIPERNLISVPDALDATVAVLAEPLAASVHAFGLAARAWCCPLAEAKVLVLGGGAVGLSAALLLRHQHVAELLLGETNPERRHLAIKEGIPAYDPRTTEVPPGHFDIVFDAVGAGATRASALAAIADGGVIIHTGLQDNEGRIDMRKVTLSEVTIIGTYAYTQKDLAAALAAVHSGVLGTLDWVDHRPMANGAAAFAELAEGRSRMAKIVLLPQGD
jgi:2-desacetyl-2-hydroxyethyl bacteriochlorophyllide A dehydrogenase